jgi:hypothetical protein
MCDDCFETLIYKFDSQQEFDDFQTILTNKFISKKLEIIKREETDFWAPFDPYEFYKCNSCGQIWILSIPENTRRGFFLTQDKGIKYTKKIKEKDKARRIGFLVIIAILAIVTIWKLFNE